MNTIAAEINEVRSELEQMSKQMDLSIDDYSENSNTLPTSISKETTEAAMKLVRDNKKKRLHISQNAVVTNIIFASPESIKKAVKGEKSEGIIKDPKSVLIDFARKLGAKIDSVSAEVIFENVVIGEEAEAIIIYERLKEACVDVEKTFPIYVTKTIPIIKGFRLRKPGADVSLVLSKTEMLDYILTKAWGVINTPDKNIQLQLKEASVKITKVKVGTRISKSMKSVYSGIAVLGVTNRKRAVESSLAEYHRQLTGGTIIKSGFKSDLKVKYYKEIKDEYGNRKIATYRIPLLVNQYVVKAIDSELIEKFGIGQVANFVSETIDLLDNDKVESYFEDIAKIVAAASINGATGEFFDELRQASAEAANIESQIADFAGV